jgi:hypothetical protein
MKKLLLHTLIFLSFAFFFKVSAEEIGNFRADLTINKDGTINVKETIDYDFGPLERHGIFRYIPQIKTNSEGKKYLMEISDFSVTDDSGALYQYKITYENGEVELKIGDPDKTITGTHQYIISYKVSGGLTYFSDHDELYWNATGNGWDIPINRVLVNVQLPEITDDSAMRMACYTGVEGSKDSNCSYSLENGKALFQTSTALSGGEGLTVVYGFPKNIVSVLEPKPYTPFWESTIGVILIFLLILKLL